MKPLVSVIILVYKAEMYIERCARSLFAQTLEDIEYIFVDDCTPDASMDILDRVLEDYPSRRSQVKVLHNDVNRGQAFSRDRGVKAATGDYIIHCDSDDVTEKTLYETLLAKALETEADIVVCDYDILQDGKTTYGCGCRCPEKDLVAAILDGSMPAYLWNKLIKRSLYNMALLPPKADIWEDKTTLVQLFHACSKVAFVQESLYTYRIHDRGTCLSEEVRRKVAKLRANVSVILSFLELNHLAKKYEWSVSALKAEVQMNAMALPRKDYLAVFPENRLRQFFAPGIPVAWKLGHLTKMLGIHGISRVFRRK